MIGIGIVGYGYWGPNLVRNFASSESSRVVAVSDLDPAKLAACKRRHPEQSTTSDFRELLHNPQVDAIAIATPVEAGVAELGLEALKASEQRQSRLLRGQFPGHREVGPVMPLLLPIYPELRPEHVTEVVAQLEKVEFVEAASYLLKRRSKREHRFRRKPNKQESVLADLKGKRILVTGGAGSIGSHYH